MSESLGSGETTVTWNFRVEQNKRNRNINNQRPSNFQPKANQQYQQTVDSAFNGESSSDGEILHGDGSTTLVIRKSLLAPKGESDEDWRRNNIFQSTCTIKDKEGQTVYALMPNNTFDDKGPTDDDPRDVQGVLAKL
ncbi:hypothetical protein IMY05_013G0050100 [Salix suchowensis]|nr:hypothetical protein IMY05_013G0050100 [Salix suchowensis]